MIKTASIRFILFLLVFSFVPAIALGQQDKIELENKRVTLALKEKPLGVVFRHLMQRYDILIGFERSNLDRGSPDYYFDTNLSGTTDHVLKNDDLEVRIVVENGFEAPNHPITVNVNDMPLRNVLDIIVKQMKHYRWEINDGVVNIFPKKGRDSRFEELLRTEVSSFRFIKGETIWQITTLIKELPEVSRFLNDNSLFFSGTRTGLAEILEKQYGRKIDVEMNFSNLTFLELLNKIT